MRLSDLPQSEDAMNDDPRDPSTGKSTTGRMGSLRVGNDISIRKLQVFWAVSHAGSMTKAARLLEVTQPTLSQQLAGLEAALGNRLFTRSGNALIATEFGIAFLRYAENVLRSVQELEDMVAEHGKGQQQTIRIGGIPSAMRALVPAAMQTIRAAHPSYDLDSYEGSPGEILDMLYARRIAVALLAANTVGELPSGFSQVPLLEDQNVLVVPGHLDLAGVINPAAELAPEDTALLRNVIQFVFGSQHSRRLQHWYDLVLPGNRVIGRTRSFELAIEMVRKGLGVCLAPALSVAPASLSTAQVRLYRVEISPRKLVAVLPTQYLQQEAYAALLAELVQGGADFTQPELLPQPPFVAAATQILNS